MGRNGREPGRGEMWVQDEQGVRSIRKVSRAEAGEFGGPPRNVPVTVGPEGVVWIAGDPVPVIVPGLNQE